MSTRLRSSKEFPRSSRSDEGEVGKVSDFDMKRRCNGISSTDLDMSIYRDPGLSTRWLIVLRSLTTLSLMDSLSSPAGEQSPSWRSSTTTVRSHISNSLTNICRWLQHYSILHYGHFRSLRLSNGTTGIQVIQRVSDSVQTSINVALAKLDYTSADQKG